MALSKTTWEDGDSLTPTHLNEICSTIIDLGTQVTNNRVKYDSNDLNTINNIEIGSGLAHSFDGGTLSINLDSNIITSLESLVNRVNTLEKSIKSSHKIIFNCPTLPKPKVGEQDVKVTFTYRVTGDVSYFSSLTLYDGDTEIEPDDLAGAPIPITNSLTTISYTIDGSFSGVHTFKLVGELAESELTVTSTPITISAVEAVWVGFVNADNISSGSSVNELPANESDVVDLINGDKFSLQSATSALSVRVPSFSKTAPHIDKLYLLFITTEANSFAAYDYSASQIKIEDGKEIPYGFSLKLTKASSFGPYYIYSLTDPTYDENVDGFDPGEELKLKLSKTIIATE